MEIGWFGRDKSTIMEINRQHSSMNRPAHKTAIKVNFQQGHGGSCSCDGPIKKVENAMSLSHSLSNIVTLQLNRPVHCVSVLSSHQASIFGLGHLARLTYTVT